VDGAGDGTAGDVLDFNAAFKTGAVTVGLDYLAADNLIDSAVNLWAGFSVNDKLDLRARYETIALEGSSMDDPTKTTLYATYAINGNLSAALEYSTGSSDDTGSGVADVTGIVDDDVTTLEFIGTF